MLFFPLKQLELKTNKRNMRHYNENKNELILA